VLKGLTGWLPRRGSIVLIALVCVLPAPKGVAASGPCGPPVTSVIACENTQPGTPSTDWGIVGSGDPSIQGFATDISVNAGGTIYFKINTNAASYHFDVLRLGYYQGNGARKVASGLRPSVSLPQSQPACLYASTTGLVDCGNWGISASWAVPITAVSGIYIAHLVRDDTGGDSHVAFVVRNDASHSDLLFQTQDTTWQAYNSYGGNDFYVGNPAGRAYKLSYNRPFNTADNQAQNWLFQNEYPTVRYLEANGFDVSYTTDADSDRNGSLIQNHKIFLSVGHDEYWSGNQRANVQAARDAGVNLAFFSGNEVYWKTRWENSTDGSGTPYRTLVCYKETWANAVIDPADPPTWTGTWRDPRFSPPADGGRPENQLTGTLTTVINDTASIQVPAADGKMRFWRNTSVANLASGQTASVGTNDLGYEWDEPLDNGFRPPGLVYLSTTTRAVQNKLDAFGGINTFPGSGTHHMTLYKAPSGALVFGAGTIQFAEGLDGGTSGTSGDPNLMQAVVNLFADMGAQPASLQPGLVAATGSTDATPPSSTITSPSAGAVFASGTSVTVTGTATDSGGGVVGGVEVSTDGGTSWHPANGRASWSYTWMASGAGTVTIKSRGVDDSGNLETPGAGVNVTVNCPCSIWGSGATPTNAAASDSNSVELGVKFRSDINGWVTGIRFYKGSTNTGTHIGDLWSSTGTQLATAQFTGETSTGWQQVSFPSAVAVTANTTYVASYFAPNGHYAADSGYFAGSGTDSPPLHALATWVSPDGVFTYASTSTYPSSTGNGTNYWVDVVFTNTAPADSPPTVTSTMPASGATGVAISTVPSATFSKAVQPATISFTLKDLANNPVAGSLSYNSITNTTTFTPSASIAYSTTYTATVSGALSLAGTPMTAPYSWSFTTAAPPSCPCTIWSGSTTPTNASAGDSSSVEMGVKFRSDVSGWVTGIRFYKGTGNTGTHIGNLWSSSGALLASATFTGETASGWQQVSLSSAVAITAGTTYIASYFAPNGHYAYDSGYFASSGTDNPPLHALANSVSPDGVFTYAGTSGFPSSSGNGTNYWVDLVFSTTAPVDSPPVVSSTTPTSGATGVAVTVAPTATFNKAVQASTISFTLKDSANNSVAGTVGYNGVTYTATFTPSAPLAYSTTYTATVSGAQDPAGTPMTGPYSWSFTTSASACPCTIWSSSTTPSNATSSDSSSVEVGVKFRSDVNGWVTGIRFYKGTGNTGTHSGHLWSAAGTLLGSATFSGETASGWQQVSFGSALPITAGTTYVASYFAPNGGYAYNSGYFSSSGTDNPPLHALANSVSPDGVFTYAGTSSFPSSSGNGTNYWVDVVFSTTAPADSPPVVSSTTPTSSATGVAVAVAPTATFNEAVQASTISFTLKDSANNPVAGTVSYNSNTFTTTFTPAAALSYGKSYTATVSGTQSLGGTAMTGPYSWSFSTVTCPCSIWSSSTTPSNTSASDTSSVELGVKFRADVNGFITGIRFYKGAGNTGTHIGNLWSSTGTLLASATFSGETASGWQQVSFSSPVAVTAGTTYVASYFAPKGGYAYDQGYFSSAGTDSPPLHALANSTSPDGVFVYAAASSFPTSSGNGTNYWVDVVFTTA
jgi:hypothetical protein